MDVKRTLMSGPMVEDDKQGELCKPLQPPDYESLYHSNATPPYPGLDAELPNYCEVATGVIVNQPQRYTQLTPPESRRRISEIGEYLAYFVIIGCAVISVVLFFPVGVFGLGYSIAALQHKRTYNDPSTYLRTAIGCILLATAVGVPIHVVTWRHLV